MRVKNPGRIILGESHTDKPSNIAEAKIGECGNFISLDLKSIIKKLKAKRKKLATKLSYPITSEERESVGFKSATIPKGKTILLNLVFNNCRPKKKTE